MTFTNGKPFPFVWFKQNNQCLNNKCPHFGKAVLLWKLSWACLGQTQLAWVPAFTSSRGLRTTTGAMAGRQDTGVQALDQASPWTFLTLGGTIQEFSPYLHSPSFPIRVKSKDGPLEESPSKRMDRVTVNLEHWILEECDSKIYKVLELELPLGII